MLDGEGNKTNQYEKLKKINRRVRALADGYLFVRDRAVYLNKCSEKERLFSENGRYKITFKNTEACFLTVE